jgi:hypothetical protein
MLPTVKRTKEHLISTMQITSAQAWTALGKKARHALNPRNESYFYCCFLEVKELIVRLSISVSFLANNSIVGNNVS